MQQETADQNRNCPRCDYLNLNATVHHGWIDWQAPFNFICKLWLNASCSLGCPPQYQVATVDTNNDEDG
jgi:hypothetical protein